MILKFIINKPILINNLSKTKINNIEESNHIIEFRKVSIFIQFYYYQIKKKLFFIKFRLYYFFQLQFKL